MDHTELAEHLSATYTARKNLRAPIDPHFQKLAEYFCPRKANISGGTQTPDGSKEAALFDGSGYYALDVAVRGQSSSIIPIDRPWFSIDPPEGLKKSFRVKQWCQEVTRKMRVALVYTGFYAQADDFLADINCFGTGAFYRERDERGVLYKSQGIGEYCISQNSRGDIDCLDREITMTAKQLAGKFGEDKVSKKVQEALKAGKGKQEQQFQVIHSIYPRSEAERMPGKIDGPNKAFASCYFELDAKNVLRVWGYDEFPYSVSRWATWKGYESETPWGYSPAWLALPDMKQLNVLQKNLDALVDKKVNPPLLIPQGYKGDIDKRPGGITWFDANSQADGRPQEWGNNGDYNIGNDRVKMKKDAVDRFFQVDMWLAVSRIDRSNVTAEEIRARLREQSRMFSSTHTRLTNDWIRPQIMGLFIEMLHAGELPEPPQEMIGQDGAGGVFLAEPSISLNSRIAMALKDEDDEALNSMFGMAGQIAAFKPDITDALDWDKAFQDIGRNRGINPDWNVDPAEIEKVRQARFEQQQQREQGEQAEKLSKAAANVGKIPGDSPMLQMMANAS